MWNGITPTYLATLGGTNGHAVGINATGQVAGFSNPTGSAAYHATLWNGTTPTDLGTLGGTSSRAEAINDSGQIAAYSDLAGLPVSVHADVWNGTTPTDLGTLGGFYSYAYGINATGQVAGFSNPTGSGSYHATLGNGTIPTDLGILDGTTDSYAYGINDFGQVVGESANHTGDAPKYFLYTGGTMYDLGSLLLPGSGVTDFAVAANGGSINNLGQIVGYGTFNGYQHALRLDPVAAPEPASAVLLSLGPLLFAARRRRSA